MTIGGIRGKEENAGQVQGGTEAVACLGDCGSMSWVDTGARRHVRHGTNAAGPVRRPVLCDAQHAVVAANGAILYATAARLCFRTLVQEAQASGCP